MNIIHIVGARPNFMKAAPVIRALAEHNKLVSRDSSRACPAVRGVTEFIIHTGQHYDDAMSEVFFRELEIPEPDLNLDVGSGTHAVQTAEIMIRLEKVLLEQRPDLVLVYGDVNSTVAAALVSAKLLIPVGHVEAGLRSFDRTMPEEINRILTDRIADLLFTPSMDGNRNLEQEGIEKEKIHFVGNVMIDTLVRLFPRAVEKWDNGGPGLPGLDEEPYALVTLHRPANVDDPAMLQTIITALDEISRDIRVIFPIHPRTRDRLNNSSLVTGSPSLLLTNPLGYLDFLALQRHAALVITDSGGIQEETTFMGVPCLTLRETTERPVTVDLGTNIIVGRDMEKFKREARNILEGNVKEGMVPPLWDGKAGERIAEKILEWAGSTPGIQPLTQKAV